MEIRCTCRTIITLSSIEDEGGFYVSHTTCPVCGQKWVLRLTKGKRIKDIGGGKWNILEG